MRNRRITFGVIAAALVLVAAVRHPSARIGILTQDATDAAPHRMKAALDLGLLAVSVLVTWTGKHIS